MSVKMLMTIAVVMVSIGMGIYFQYDQQQKLTISDRGKKDNYYNNSPNHSFGENRDSTSSNDVSINDKLREATKISGATNVVRTASGIKNTMNDTMEETKTEQKSDYWLLWDATSSVGVGAVDPALILGSDVCTIERIHETEMTATQFKDEYWRQKPVILIRNNDTNAAAQQMTTKKALLDKFGDEKIPLAKLESYAFRDEQSGTLKDYLNAMGYQHGMPDNMSRFAFSSDQFHVGSVYVIPNTAMSEVPNLLDPSFQLAIAGPGTGLAFHWHTDVWAETLHGTRRWFLFPPHTSPPFNPRMTSAQWVQDIYPKVLATASTDNYNETQLLHVKEALQECLLKQNEAIYVPADWFHATLSLGEAVSLTTSYASTFRRDRYHIHHGTSDNANMLDAFTNHDFEKASYYAEKLTQHRPYSFVPYSWLGVVRTMGAREQHTGSLSEFQRAIHLALSATLKCIDLNPYFCPCHVWASRQLKALAATYHAFMTDTDFNTMKSKTTTSDMKQEQLRLLQQAQIHVEMAAKLSSVNDDELLDPRWQPKSMNAARKARGHHVQKIIPVS